MFSIDTQEVHDANTGVAIAFGDHGNATCWMRITTKAPSADGSEVVQKVSTVFFQKDGDVLRIVAHDMSPSTNEETAKELDAATRVDNRRQQGVETERAFKEAEKEAELQEAAHELFDKDEPSDEELATKRKRK